MYQALYRKWRPRTFEDVVGQAHITETLKRQVAAGRLSHAYLFTGTRGTGKTTCAKILAKAVNCENPVDGNPCNCCPACVGIDSGSILDVLELDAASNNGVDHVRALRDEAVYSPAAVRKRVYIVDEVHMLSNQAFNALLKILEEPPEHLMFILATTELHKVLATIRSRCQQFSFKRILPGDIAGRLSYVAQQEGLELTAEGAALLARLADGGLRDGLSLLDQCAGAQDVIDEQKVLDTLGLAGNLETAAMMELISAADTAGALESLGRLYAAGKDVGAVLGELSVLTRDLLLRRTAPQGAAALISGSFDEVTMRNLGERFTAQRLMQMLTLLQQAVADLEHSANRRTDAELCLIRLCDVTLDESVAGLSARIAQLEQRLADGGAPVIAAPGPAPAAAPKPAPVAPPAPAAEDRPPWEEAPAPKVQPTPVEEKSQLVAPAAPQPEPARSAPVAQSAGAVDAGFWPAFAAGLRGVVVPSHHPYLTNPQLVNGTWKDGVLTLWVKDEFTKSLLSRPAGLTDVLAKAASARFGQAARAVLTVGEAPVQTAPAPTPQPQPEVDALDELLDFGSKFDNIIINE